MKLFTTLPLPPVSDATVTSVPKTATAAFATFFRHPSAAILSGLGLGAVAARATLGPLAVMDLIVVVALLMFWPLLEWGIHVFMLHRKPITRFGRQWDFLLPQTHRWHHADPWNLELVFIPLHIYPVVAPLIFGLTWWLSPSLEFACTLLGGYFLLALHYEWVHYLAHINWRPPGKYYARRVAEHRLHHFRNQQLWWGVSMGLGDRLLGTAPDLIDSEKSGDPRKII